MENDTTASRYGQLSFCFRDKNVPNIISLHHKQQRKQIEIDLVLFGSTAPEGGRRFTVAQGEDINNAAVWRRQARP